MISYTGTTVRTAAFPSRRGDSSTLLLSSRSTRSSARPLPARPAPSATAYDRASHRQRRRPLGTAHDPSAYRGHLGTPSGPFRTPYGRRGSQRRTPTRRRARRREQSCRAVGDGACTPGNPGLARRCNGGTRPRRPRPTREQGASPRRSCSIRPCFRRPCRPWLSRWRSTPSSKSTFAPPVTRTTAAHALPTGSRGAPAWRAGDGVPRRAGRMQYTAPAWTRTVGGLLRRSCRCELPRRAPANSRSVAGPPGWRGSHFEDAQGARPGAARAAGRVQARS